MAQAQVDQHNKELYENFIRRPFIRRDRRILNKVDNCSDFLTIFAKRRWNSYFQTYLNQTRQDVK